MTQKRFTNIEHDYENAWIKCNDDGDFMIYAIYKELDESLPSLEDLLNGLSEENEQLKKEAEEYNENAMSYQALYEQQLEKCEELKEEKEKWKSNCSLAISENSILWNEISILREQGAEPSKAFQEYVKKKIVK